MRKSLPILVVVLASCLICPPATAENDGGSSAVQRAMAKSLDAVGRKMIALAEATPAERFAWRPTEEARTVSEVYMHVAASNFHMPATLGAAPPEGIEIPDAGPYALKIQRQQWEAEVREKEAVVDMLRRSFAYASEAIPGVTGLNEIVAPFGFRDTKLDYLLLVVSHAHEHLGQSIAYARSAGIVPPWSVTREPPQRESVAEIEGDSARGRIESIDRFGNLVTDLVPADLETLGLAVGDTLALAVGEATVEVFVADDVMDVGDGEWFAVVNPNGTLTMGRSYASAAETLSCEAGDAVAIRPAER